MSKTRRQFPLVFIILVLFGGLLAFGDLGGRNRTAADPDVAKRGDLPTKSEDPYSGIAPTCWTWATTAAILTIYDQTATLPGIQNVLAWKEFTPVYLESLAKRRQEALDWARNGDHEAIKIVFIADTHLDPAMGSDLEAVQLAQRHIVETVVSLAAETHAITIEASGADGPLTWDKYMDTSVIAANRYDAWMIGGLLINREQIEQPLIEQAQLNADITLLRTPGLPPIIFGEELAPHRLDEWLLMMQSDGALSPTDDRFIMIPLLRKLRSELAIIRALEFLRSTGGSHAVIIQGYAHAEDFPAYAPEYGIDIRIVE